MIEMERYLQEVYSGLSGLPKNERNEILGEIRNHIHEAIARQEPVQSVIDRLGSPIKLAQSYVNIYNIENNNTGSNVWRDMVFFIWAGSASYIIILTLVMITVTLPLTAIFMIGHSILDLFIELPAYGLPSYSLEIWHNLSLTGFPALIASVPIGVILFVLGILCGKLLKVYMVFIPQRYEKFRTGK